MRVSLTINGEEHQADCWEGESLLFALREKLGFPGSKNACEQGECGSCSVLMDGELVCAFTTVRAVKSAAPAQRKVVRGLGIDDVKLMNAAALLAGSRPAHLRPLPPLPRDWQLLNWPAPRR